MLEGRSLGNMVMLRCPFTINS